MYWHVDFDSLPVELNITRLSDDLWSWCWTHSRDHLPPSVVLSLTICSLRTSLCLSQLRFWTLPERVTPQHAFVERSLCFCNTRVENHSFDTFLEYSFGDVVDILSRWSNASISSTSCFWSVTTCSRFLRRVYNVVYTSRHGHWGSFFELLAVIVIPHMFHYFFYHYQHQVEVGTFYHELGDTGTFLHTPKHVLEILRLPWRCDIKFSLRRMVGFVIFRL
jgi:hypothetical protein